MLNYVLAENVHTKKEKKFIALITDSETKNMDDIIDLMVSEGTGMTRPQTLAYFEKLKQVIRFYLEQGYSVSTPLVRFRPSIRGTFLNISDRFDPSRHRIMMRAVAGTFIKEVETVVQPVCVTVDNHIPYPVELKDAATNLRCTSIAAGSIGKLRGDNLSFDPTDLQQGVFLIPMKTGSDEIRISTYSYSVNSEIHFLFPHFLNGDYTLEVRKLDRSKKKIIKGNLPLQLQLKGLK